MNRKLIAAIATTLAFVLVIVVYFLAKEKSRMDWPSVKAAMMARETIHGQGRVYDEDGQEWEFAIWGIMKPGDEYESKGMIIPVNPVTEEGPSPEVLRISNTMDYCGTEGIVTELLRQGARRERIKQGTWANQRVLLAEVDKPNEVWVMAIDPENKLPLGLEMFVLEGSERRLRARCEYEYDRPLPAGFKQAPG